MHRVDSDMEDFCSHIRYLVEWLNVTAKIPMTFAEPGFRETLETPPQPFIELYLVTEGSLRLDVQHKNHVLRPGDLALANAHFGNKGREVSGGFRYGCLSLEVPDTPPFAHWKRAPLLLWRSAPDFAHVQNLYREVAHVYHGPEHPFQDVLLKATFLQLLAAAGDTGVRSHGSTQNRIVRKAVEIMSERRRDPDLTLTTIARRIGVSPSHLTRVFRANLGRSPMRYLTELRVRHAQGLLLRSNLIIKEIAGMVGFGDQLYFSRVFRQQTGVSPLAYRRAKAG
jgi:AraC-like DNA-binding protein